MSDQSPEYAWNDPTLEAAESAVCPCGHEALDHSWSGCETCAEPATGPRCKRSAIHAALASGVVAVVIRPERTGES